MRRGFASLIIVLVAALAGCAQESPSPQGASGSAASPAPPPVVTENNLPSDPKNIVNIAAASKDHSTLVSALKAAGYVDALSNPGPFTVFAPTNEAFAKLPAGTLDGLMKPDKAADLRNILQYHVAPAVLETKDLKDGMTLGMVSGGKITIHVKDGKITVNDANVITTIRGSNGIIYVLDAVLLPQAK
jgi:uncharacterized surface protein with fasciclin (FAS1) repeats